MGLLNELLGNASEVNVENIQAEFAPILAPSEQIERTYQLIRDYFFFTNRRLILVDKQDLTGQKVQYHSIPVQGVRFKTIKFRNIPLR